MPTRPSSASARSSAALVSRMPCALNGSATCQPTPNTGLSDASASWNTMPISSPQRARHSAMGAPSTSAPSKRMLPPVMCAGGDARRRMMAAAVTLLPEPLSPSTASVSPRRTENVAPLTARTISRPLRNSTRRSFTSSRGGSSSAIGLRRRLWRLEAPALHGIRDQPHPVGKQVRRQRRGHDREARKKREPPRLAEIVTALSHHQSPGDFGWLNADTEKAERGLGQHHDREIDGHDRQQRRRNNGNHVTPQDVRAAASHRPRCIDESAFANFKHLGPRNAQVRWNARYRQYDDEV